MKKRYFLGIIFTTLTHLSLAQVTTDPITGNVGITNTNPQTKLDVNGGILVGGNNLDNRNGDFPLTFLQNSGKMLVGWNRTQGAGEIDFFANQGGGSVGGFAFYNYDNSRVEKQLMWLTGDGRLMLGLSTGSTGNNKLAVGGGIIAESVTVKLQANWPDYVFQPDYSLKPLSEVENYIDQNHHLPDMPSAAEVESDGLNLGKMNKILTQKVEELTLYLIKQQKEIDALKNKRQYKNTLRKLNIQH